MIVFRDMNCSWKLSGFLFENPYRRTFTWLQLDIGHQATAVLSFQANLQRGTAGSTV